MAKWMLTITPGEPSDEQPWRQRLDRRLLKFPGLSFIHRQLLTQQLSRTACVGVRAYRKERQAIKIYDFYWQGEFEIKANKKPKPGQRGVLWAKRMSCRSLSGGGLCSGVPLVEVKFPRRMEIDEQLRLEAMIKEAGPRSHCHRLLEEDGWKFDRERFWIVGKVEVKKIQQGGTP